MIGGNQTEAVLYLVEHGFHGKTIARACGVRLGDVYYIARQAGMRLRDYRDGKTDAAVRVMRATKNIRRYIRKVRRVA